MGHNSLVVLLLQETLKTQLDARLNRHVPPEFPGVPPLGENLVLSVIFIHQGVDVALGHRCDRLRDLRHRVGVHLPAEFDLGLHLVALGDGYVAHIVRDAHHPDVAALDHAHRGPHPGRDPALNVRVRPVAHHHLALHTQPGENVAVLPVPVGRLVFIHEVHVNGVVGDLAVELGVQVQQGLAVLLKSQNPGFGRGKGVHPGDHTRAVFVVVGLV